MARPKKEPPTRKDGLYEYKLLVGRTLDGKRIRKSFYSSISKEDAKRQAEEYKIAAAVARQTNETLLLKDVGFRDWAEKWLKTYKKGAVKGNTYRNNYESIIRLHLIPHFGSADLRDIKPIDIQRFLDAKAKDYSAESLKKMRVCLFSIFEAAIENDLCPKNPVTRNIKIKTNNQPVEKRTYTQKQYDIVLEFAKTHPDGLPIMVLLETGITRSELLGLRWCDIDFDNNVIYVKQGTVEMQDPESGKWETVSGGLKNAYRARYIPVKKFLIDALRIKPRTIEVGGNKRKKRPPTIVAPELVFHDAKGGALNPNNWYTRVYQPFMEELTEKHPDIPALTPHELRHTRATLWKDAGIDIFTIAKLMGHADLDMLSKRYAHNNVDSLKKALGLAE